MEKTADREQYESPSLTAHGSIESLTQGASSGNVLDATFPVGTPVGDITFS
jgi:hypothetical protein